MATRVVSSEVRTKYGVFDVDVAIFLDTFVAEEGSKILVVGAHDESVANMLSECGFDVTGVDLREYDKNLPPPNYRWVRGDFCDPDLFNAENGCYDVFVCLSALEHFGMGSYREGKVHRYYDVIAMRKAWELLRVGGRAYVTVPFGGSFIEVWPHWRVYDLDSARNRLVQDFELLKIDAISAGDNVVKGRKLGWGQKVPLEDLPGILTATPSVSTLMVMEKTETRRLAPDGV